MCCVGVSVSVSVCWEKKGGVVVGRLLPGSLVCLAARVNSGKCPQTQQTSTKKTNRVEVRPNVAFCFRLTEGSLKMC